jgi:glycine oxidase
MTDVVVAGGGLIGLAVAWRCAQRGLGVTVVDDRPAAGASYAAAGMLAPVTEAAYGEEPLLALCRASLDRYPAFLAEVERAGGVPVALRTGGTLTVGFDADDMRELEALQTFQAELGLHAHRLTPSQARRREPSLTPRLRGAVFAPEDHSVDSRALRAGLLAAARAAGVRMLPARVEALRLAGDRVTGLRLRSVPDVVADTVVLALGAWSALVSGVPDLLVRPVKGQILRLRGARGLLTGTVRALVRGRPVYLVPYDADGLIVGATVEERGFDDTVTAGAVHDLLRDAIEVVPDVSELELTEVLARWRPGTPDNAPILGPTALPGLVAATGHYRNGVLLTPVTAEVIAETIGTGTPPALVTPFLHSRFRRPSVGGDGDDRDH